MKRTLAAVLVLGGMLATLGAYRLIRAAVAAGIAKAGEE